MKAYSNARAVSAWMLGLQAAVTVSAAVCAWVWSGPAAAGSALAGGGMALVATALLAGALLLLFQWPSRRFLLALCVAEILKLSLIAWLFIVLMATPGIHPGVLLAAFGAALAVFFAAPLLPPLRRGALPA